MDTLKKHVRKFMILPLLVIPLLGMNQFKKPFLSEIIEEYSQEMEEKYGLHFVGKGGSFSNKINLISIFLQSPPVKDIDEARNLEILATETFLKIINNHKSSRNKLARFPFRAENTEILISFDDVDGKTAPDSLANVFQVNGAITYKIDHPDSHTHETIHREPYEEAYKIVMGSQ